MSINSEVPIEGRNAVLVIMGIFLTLTIVNIGISVREDGPMIIPAVRTILTILLVYFLYEGYPWARWVSAVLSGFGGLVGFWGVYTIITSVGTPIGYVYAGAMGILGAAFCGVSASLIFSARIKAFLKFQQIKRWMRRE